MATTQKLTAIQKQILLFLGTGGPAYVYTGSRTTDCGHFTGGSRFVHTNTVTKYMLVEHGMIVQDMPGRNNPWRVNREHPLVAKLLDFGGK